MFAWNVGKNFMSFVCNWTETGNHLFDAGLLFICRILDFLDFFFHSFSLFITRIETIESEVMTLMSRFFLMNQKPKVWPMYSWFSNRLGSFLWINIVHRNQCSPTSSQTNDSFESNIQFTMLFYVMLFQLFLHQNWPIKEPESLRNQAPKIPILIMICSSIFRWSL